MALLIIYETKRYVKVIASRLMVIMSICMVQHHVWVVLANVALQAGKLHTCYLAPR